MKVKLFLVIVFSVGAAGGGGLPWSVIFFLTIIFIVPAFNSYFHKHGWISECLAIKSRSG